MKWTRRDVLKGLGGLPIVGGIWWAGAATSLISNKERLERKDILEQLNMHNSNSPLKPATSQSSRKMVRLGDSTIVGDTTMLDDSTILGGTTMLGSTFPSTITSTISWPI